VPASLDNSSALLIAFSLFDAVAQRLRLSLVQERVFSVRKCLLIPLLDFLPGSQNEFLLTIVSLETQEKQ